MNKNLGRLEKVELRDIWANEAGNFTPWLAEEGNLALLGDTIGIDLELESQETHVGPFRADILCRDTTNGDWVLIENQLERTDHTHLGQIMTYAAGLKAVTIVWIADEFTDEHRAALDWLNGITEERFNFFGLEVELWKIGESLAAPKFNVVCEPNDWSRAVTSATSGGDGQLSETRLLQREFWTELRELLIQRKSSVNPQKPLPQNWTNFSLGRSSFYLWASLNTVKNFVSVGMSCVGPDAKAHFKLLEQDKETIENELSETLEWNYAAHRKSSWVNLNLEDSYPTDKLKWNEQHQWIAEKIEKLYRTFAPRVKVLNAEDFLGDE
jgi:hypothetical protein